jgi:hypothetical protein
MSPSMRIRIVASIGLCTVVCVTLGTQDVSGEDPPIDYNIPVDYYRDLNKVANRTVLIRMDDISISSGKNGAVDLRMAIRNTCHSRLRIVERALVASIEGSVSFWRVGGKEVYRIRRIPGVHVTYAPLHELEIAPNQTVLRNYRIGLSQENLDGVIIRTNEFVCQSPSQIEDQSWTSADRLPKGQYGVSATAEIETVGDDAQGLLPTHSCVSESLNLAWCLVAD